MKNYVIGVLGAIILVLISIIYKNEISLRNRIPIPVGTKNLDEEVHLILYIFFSKNNCPDCLEIIDLLNNLPSYFVVFGIVPGNELKEEKELRRITNASFPLIDNLKYRKYIPWYTPTIIGISPTNGDVLFTLPGVPGEKEYLGNFLESFYRKSYPFIFKDKSTKTK
ncbi:MAG TPA: hypothetical protein VK469_00400 [Candidatus Kapabacteria bacterium]|nr:hypothetical protein [Candidatus Kapabacteria bacterium]